MELLNQINDFLWTYIVITMLAGCAIYFTIRTRGVQFRYLRDMFLIMLGKNVVSDANAAEDAKDGESVSTDTDKDSSIRKIGSFQAFAVSLSSRVGTGNLAGVASAIFVGGPGAIFWMWIMALLGSATAFVESTLAQLYKKRGDDSYYGGPAYYMETGLKARWMGVLFAIAITVTFGMANQVVQSTTLCDSLSDTFVWDKAVVGIVLTISTMLIIFGGIRRISHFASICVPFMALGFIVLSLVIVVINITQLPKVITLIVENAFGVGQVAGGAFGIAVMQGVKRGLFSNEAGEGSAPNAAAIADTSHPIKQGLLQSLGVFADTIIICTCTAFIIMISGKYDCGKDGILLTAEALESEIGSIGRYFITAAIFLFAFSTIIANYFYGETNVRFATKNKANSTQKIVINIFRLLTGVTIMTGALVDLQTAFSFVDVVMGLMTILNLTAILLLFKHVLRLLKDYDQQKRDAMEPQFHRSSIPELAEEVECWE